MPYAIGDYIEGRDHDYEVYLAGTVTEIGRHPSGQPELFFVNELPGEFEGKRVALPASWVKVHQPDRESGGEVTHVSK